MAKSNKNSSSPTGYAVEQIFKSGLLLDEDFDAILLHYSVDDEYSPQITISLRQKLLSGVSVAGTIFLIQQEYPLSYISFTVAPLVLLGSQHLRGMLYRKRQKRDVEMLVKTVGDILKLLRMVSEYFKLKDSQNTDLMANVSCYTKPNEKLIEVTFYEVCHFIYGLMYYVQQFGLLVPSLSEYVYLERLDLEQFDKSRVTSIKDCANYMQKLCDIFVLVSSNTLTCLAIIFCTNVTTKFNINTNDVLDVVVPKMRTISITCYERINKEFEDVKYYYINKNGIVKTRVAPPLKRGKVYMGTTSIIVHTSEIVEKSEAVLRELEKPTLDLLPEKEVLVTLVGQLRTQVYEYYECLEMLFKLIEIDIKKSKPRGLKDSLASSTEPSEKSSSIVVEPYYEDTNLSPIEGSDDEEYEAYVGAYEPSGEEAAGTTYYEDSDNHQYAALLSRELKTKLKTHAAFAAARQKRGIVDEEPENAQAAAAPSAELYPLPPLPPPPPLFQLGSIPSFPLPVKVPDPLPNCDDFNARNHIPPPPPPPPLRPIDLGPYGDMAGSPYTVVLVESFLDAIKIVSASKEDTVEVFQCSSDNEDE